MAKGLREIATFRLQLRPFGPSRVCETAGAGDGSQQPHNAVPELPDLCFQRSDQRCVYQATSPASAASPSSRTRSRTTCLPLPTVAPLLGVNASRWRGRAKWTSLVASSGGIGPARPWAAACPSGEPSAARAAAVATGGMSFDDAPAPAPGDRDHAPGDLVPVLGGAAHGPVPALARALVCHPRWAGKLAAHGVVCGVTGGVLQCIFDVGHLLRFSLRLDLSPPSSVVASSPSSR